MTIRFRRSLALILAFLILISGTGWSMDLHFCQGNLRGISFISKSQNCHNKGGSKACQKKKKACHHSSIELSEEEKNTCCENRAVDVEADDTDKVSVSHLNLDLHHDDVVLVPMTVSLQIIRSLQKHSPQKYRPPPSHKDFQILLQIFRL